MYFDELYLLIQTENLLDKTFYYLSFWNKVIVFNGFVEKSFLKKCSDKSSLEK